MTNGYLNYAIIDLEKRGAIHTAQEISSQPGIWQQVYKTVSEKSKELNKFLDKICAIDENADVILTGAGTSAFIGEVLEGIFNKSLKFNTRAIATTDIVTHPNYYFKKNKTTILISFARSGNSPESVKAVELANQVCSKIFHLIITCNPVGELAKNAKGENCFVIFMPPESDDKSLAMTSSFTSMLLCGLLIANPGKIENLEPTVNLLCEYGKKVIDKFSDTLLAISKLEFNRAVFLGSGIFLGIAHESHLKLQELTDGRVICKYDTFLGFRHGPKAVINENTLIVYLFSNDEYVNQYEKDLVRSVNENGVVLCSLAVAEHDIPNIKVSDKIIFGNDLVKIDESFLTIVEVLPAQILGFFKSLNLGLKPDTPSESGTITRVVEGVKIYQYNN